MDKGLSKHASDLTLKFNATSRFVTMSVLFGAHSLSRNASAPLVVKHWLAVAEQLLLLRNLHMAFAVQAGLAKHQVSLFFLVHVFHCPQRSIVFTGCGKG